MTSLAKINWQPILEGGDGPPLLVIAFSGVIVLAIVAVIQWRRVRIAEADASVKMRMVDRGYSAEQIDRVLQSKVKGQRHARVSDRELFAGDRSPA